MASCHASLIGLKQKGVILTSPFKSLKDKVIAILRITIPTQKLKQHNKTWTPKFIQRLKNTVRVYVDYCLSELREGGIRRH
jgi:hypothetical protein